MHFVDRYPVVVTDRMAACRDFYVRHLGFEARFESTWFTWLATPDQSASIAFMTPDHPSAPPGPEAFGGTGLSLELEVEDAAAAHAAITATGLAADYPVTDEPFGQRRFGFRDPSGLWVNVIEQIEPAEGYWDRYVVA